MCVKYRIGDPLPEKVQVAVIDSHTMEFSKDAYVDVEVSYPQRPMICTGCHSLGHMVGACPIVKRIWVQKKIKEPVSVAKGVESAVEVNGGPVSKGGAENKEVSAQTTVEVEAAENKAKVDVNNDDSSCGAEQAGCSEGGWTTIGSKGSTVKNPEQLPRAVETPIYTAIAKSLSKGQLKRARKAGGRNSPHKK
ncbi:hypothetical protein ACET3Z_018274 [Daucus carota]